MPPHQLLGLAYTETCLFACDHCIREASPSRSGKMHIRDAKGYIRSADEIGIPSVGITGGEPFLFFPEILKLVEFASGLGMETSVITSGYWAADPARAGEMLSKLAEKGLDVLGVSWDEFHERHVPVSFLYRLADLCSRLGLRMVLNVCRSTRTRMNHEDIKAKVHEQNLVPLGRASSLPDDLFLQYEEPPSGSCGNLLNPMVDWNGEIFACCGPGRFSSPTSPLRLGNANDSRLRETLLKAAEDPILGAIHVWGPYGLWRLLEDEGHNQLYTPKERYLGGICMFCLDLLDQSEVVAILRRKLRSPETKRRLEAAILVANYRIRVENTAKNRSVSRNHSQTTALVPSRERN
jgi:hypothetical protein